MRGPRYLAVVHGGLKNPHRGAVAQDISGAILKQKAEKGQPALYWPQGEQVERLEAAWKKWVAHGKVWSAAAAKVSGS